jgi:eukaryotic-like serine/threonine-protein kinase
MKGSNHLSDHIIHEGRRVGGYRLLSLLGRGGFGDVYLGEQVHDHSQVAVKILQTRLTHSKDIKDFINEARMFRLQHPHIIPLLDFGVDHDDIPFLVMAYAAHGNLRQRYERGIRLSPHLVAYYVSQIASALQYAHDRHVIHCDVKPENMLLSADDRMMLTDFGIASVVHSTQSFSNDKKNVGGTVHYMAPEQLQGKPCPASDQYALGIVAYEWLCGQRPFDGNYLEISIQHITASPPSLCNQVPRLTPEIEAIILKALAKDPNQRFPTIQDFADALQHACQMLPSSPTATRLKSIPRLVPIDSLTETPPTQPLSPTPSPPVAGRIETMSATLAAGAVLTPPAQNPLSTRPRFTNIQMIPTLLLLACILLIGSISVLYLLSNLQGGGAQASKKTNALTATSTMLTIPVSTSPAAALHAIEARPPDYQDALNNSQNSATVTANWSNNSGCTFTADGYRVFSSTGHNFCHELGKLYSNYAARITMTIASGASGTSGSLLIRDQALNQVTGAYMFEVIADGHYKISDIDGWHPLAYATSPAIHQGVGALNTLEVLARGSSLSFFVNGTLLIQLTNTHYTQGTLSLAIFQGSSASMGSVYFKNLSVWPI